MCCVSELISGPTARTLRVSSPIERKKRRLILATVASFALFLWDYILTFGMEVDLIWKSKWNFMKALYLLQRYLPFIDTIGLVLYSQSDAFSILFSSFFFISSNEDRVDED